MDKLVTKDLRVLLVSLVLAGHQAFQVHLVLQEILVHLVHQDHLVKEVLQVRLVQLVILAYKDHRVQLEKEDLLAQLVSYFMHKVYYIITTKSSGIV